jgi:hypothetical protein
LTDLTAQLDVKGIDRALAVRQALLFWKKEAKNFLNLGRVER